MRDSVPFCSQAQGDSRLRLGVLGVLTFADRLEYREQIRRSWMRSGESADGILTRFVLRGIGASDAVQDEARDKDDIVFVRASTTLRRTIGPLASFIRWLECAAVAWPRAQLIGKADDDVHLHSHSKPLTPP